MDFDDDEVKLTLCELLDLIQFHEEIDQAYRIGDQSKISSLATWLWTHKNESMAPMPRWTEEFEELLQLSLGLRDVIVRYGGWRVEYAHRRHPRYDCTSLVETECLITITEFGNTSSDTECAVAVNEYDSSSSYISIPEDRDDLPDDVRDQEDARDGAHREVLR